MQWFLQHWQSIAALSIVALTLAIFVVRLARPKKKSGCGGGCGCETTRDSPKMKAPGPVDQHRP